jgi:hypothetical protein
MKVLCRLGRHKWRLDSSDPKRPVEVCDRCGHYRNDDSWTDLTAASNMPPNAFPVQPGLSGPSPPAAPPNG